MFDFPPIGAVGIRTTAITINELTGALVIGQGILADIIEQVIEASHRVFKRISCLFQGVEESDWRFNV